MTEYSVRGKEFYVQHQEQNWLCWASVAVAIANYHNIQTPVPTSLANLFDSDQESFAAAMFDKKGAGTLNSPRSPHGALKALCGMDNTSLKYDKATDSSVASRVTELGEELKKNLPKGPMIIGLTTHDDSTWLLKGKAQPYIWKHAVIAYSYDDSLHNIKIADPAKRLESERYKTISLRDLVKGFEYAKGSDFGPQAQGMFSGTPPDTKARIYLLVTVTKGG